MSHLVLEWSGAGARGKASSGHSPGTTVWQMYRQRAHCSRATLGRPYWLTVWIAFSGRPHRGHGPSTELAPRMPCDCESMATPPVESCQASAMPLPQVRIHAAIRNAAAIGPVRSSCSFYKTGLCSVMPPRVSEHAETHREERDDAEGGHTEYPAQDRARGVGSHRQPQYGPRAARRARAAEGPAADPGGEGDPARPPTDDRQLRPLRGREARHTASSGG